MNYKKDNNTSMILILILAQNQEYIYAITKNATTYEQLVSNMSQIQT